MRETKTPPMPSDPMQELIEAAKGALAVFAEQAEAYCTEQPDSRVDWPTFIIGDFRRAAEVFSALSNAETHLPPAPGSLALGAAPEGGEERNSASVDESGGSPPAAAKSASPSSAGWRDWKIDVPPDGERVLILLTPERFGVPVWIDTFDAFVGCWDNHGNDIVIGWQPLPPAENGALSPSANGASAGNSGLDEPIPPALPYSAASRP